MLRLGEPKSTRIFSAGFEAHFTLEIIRSSRSIFLRRNPINFSGYKAREMTPCVSRIVPEPTQLYRWMVMKDLNTPKLRHDPGVISVNGNHGSSGRIALSSKIPLAILLTTSLPWIYSVRRKYGSCSSTNFYLSGEFLF